MAKTRKFTPNVKFVERKAIEYFSKSLETKSQFDKFLEPSVCSNLSNDPWF